MLLGESFVFDRLQVTAEDTFPVEVAGFGFCQQSFRPGCLVCVFLRTPEFFKVCLAQLAGCNQQFREFLLDDIHLEWSHGIVAASDQESGNVCRRIAGHCSVIADDGIEEQVRHLRARMMPLGIANPGVKPVESGLTRSQFVTDLREVRAECRRGPFEIVAIVRVAGQTAAFGEGNLATIGVGSVSVSRTHQRLALSLRRRLRNQELRDGANFQARELSSQVVFEIRETKELRHLRCGSEAFRLLGPVGDPLGGCLVSNPLQARSDFSHRAWDEVRVRCELISLFGSRLEAQIGTDSVLAVKPVDLVAAEAAVFLNELPAAVGLRSSRPEVGILAQFDDLVMTFQTRGIAKPLREHRIFPEVVV